MDGVRQRLREIRRWVVETLSANLTPRSVGAAVGVGVFIGCLPTFGVHIFMCIAVARWLRLNQGLMYLAANISNPFFIVPLLASELSVGRWLLRGGVHPTPLPSSAAAWMTLLGNGGSILAECAVGSLVVGAVLGVILGSLAMGVAHLRGRGIVARSTAIDSRTVEDATPAG